MAACVDVSYVDAPPSAGPWVHYAPHGRTTKYDAQRLFITHDPGAWMVFDGRRDIDECKMLGELAVVVGHIHERAIGHFIGFDLAANAFYFLSSWSERLARSGSRQLFGTSTFSRLGVPQDIVDRYLKYLLDGLSAMAPRGADARAVSEPWPADATFAVALTHDVDFLPAGLTDNLRQGARTFARHLFRHRSPLDAMLAGARLTRALVSGRDPYGCVPEIITAEKHLGVRSSFQVAVARRHPADVNYDVDDDRTREYLRVITEAGFELCLHGSYRSTEKPDWYRAEVEKLSQRLARPLGSRQHYLSFDYDSLFSTQEACGIRYDMSMGFPDYHGSRVGFSHPYFPFDFSRDRAFNVVEIGLVLMDATLRGYMNLAPSKARVVIDNTLRGLRDRRGAASVVWHPIVFGGARDPGYDDLYWELIGKVKELGGWATDGRSINDAWRARARRYASFAWA